MIRTTAEAFYFNAHPFALGAGVYAAALIALPVSSRLSRRWPQAVGTSALVAALALHGAGFASRWILAARIPIQNQFESLTAVALAGALMGTAFLAATRRPIYGIAASGVGFIALLTATALPVPGARIEPEAAILATSALLKYHVGAVLLSYGAIGLAFIVSLAFLLVEFTGRLAGRRAAALDDLDRAQGVLLHLAFWTLGVGILLGAWWADSAWGRWWAFDPKETWALLTWVVYLGVIHVRVLARDRAPTITAWLSVLGFLVTLWSYFGVNLLIPGLHAYA